VVATFHHACVGGALPPAERLGRAVAGGTVQVRVSAFQLYRMLEPIFVLVFDKGPDLLDGLFLLVQFFCVPRDVDAHPSGKAHGVNVHRAIGIDLPDEAVQVTGMADVRAAAIAGHLPQNFRVPGSKLVGLAHRWQCFPHFLGKAQVSVLLPATATPIPDQAQSDNGQQKQS